MRAAPEKGLQRDSSQSLQVRAAPDADAEVSWRARPLFGTEEAQRSVLQSVAALPGQTLAAGSDTGAIQFHKVEGDAVRLTHILQASL